jgi:DNA repair protein RadD
MIQTSLFEAEVEKIARMRPLRPRQIRAIASIREAIREGHKRIILQAPTGFGKTLTSAHIIDAALQKGSRPLFTCPAISLVDQTLAAFEAEGIHDIGVIQASHARTNHSATVQIASVQTLIRRARPNVTFVLIDEMHEVFAGLNEMLDSPEWKDIIVIGLTATPWTKGLGLRWTKLVIAGTILDMIAEGHACPAIVYGPEHDINRSELDVERGEFKDASASAAMTDATIIGDVLKEWKEKSPGEKTFAFCVNRDHAKAQMEAFADDGIPFGYIDALVDKDERKRIFAQMGYGEIAGIVSVGCLIRGIDEDVRCILDLQPTKSEMRHVQKWGRGVRMAEGKAHLLGLDHAGNNQALGLFTDIFHDTLDTRKPGERGEAYKDDYKPAKPRKCAQCHNLVPAGARACPTCRQTMPLYPGVTVKDGRLVEIRPEPKMSREQTDWLRELTWIARKSGFKNGWVRHAFEERFGMAVKEVPQRGKKPTDEVKAFVREKRKEYLATKRAAETTAKVESIEMSL